LEQAQSNGARALWTFLGLMLIAPFLAGLAVAVIVGLAGPLGLGPLLPDGLPNFGVAGLFAFVWAVLPSVIASLVIVPVVWRTGTFGMLVAVVAGVFAFFLATIFTEMPYREVMPGLALLAAVVTLGVRYCLMAGGIILEGEAADAVKPGGKSGGKKR